MAYRLIIYTFQIENTLYTGLSVLAMYALRFHFCIIIIIATGYRFRIQIYPSICDST